MSLPRVVCTVETLLYYYITKLFPCSLALDDRPVSYISGLLVTALQNMMLVFNASASFLMCDKITNYLVEAANTISRSTWPEQHRLARLLSLTGFDLVVKTNWPCVNWFIKVFCQPHPKIYYFSHWISIVRIGSGTSSQCYPVNHRQCMKTIGSNIHRRNILVSLVMNDSWKRLIKKTTISESCLLITVNPYTCYIFADI